MDNNFLTQSQDVNREKRKKSGKGEKREGMGEREKRTLTMAVSEIEICNLVLVARGSPPRYICTVSPQMGW